VKRQNTETAQHKCLAFLAGLLASDSPDVMAGESVALPGMGLAGAWA